MFEEDVIVSPPPPPPKSSVIFKNMREKMGLDRCRIQGSAAAPIGRSILEFFLDFDIPLFELYGMSESSGPQTLSLWGE